MQPSEPWLQNDTEWIACLCGQRGADLQRRSHAALAKYLYRVAYNYLLVRQNDIEVLASFANDDLAALAEEFVQDFMLKITINDFALLKKFQGAGRFTSFAAVILRRMIAKELLKKSWTAREPRSEHRTEADNREQALMLETLTEDIHTQNVLGKCLQMLSARERLVIVRSLIEGYGPQEIAPELKTTANTVSIVLFRAKNKLRICLEAEDILI